MKRNLIILVAFSVIAFTGCSKTPVDIKIQPEKVEIYDQGGTAVLRVTAFDKKGDQIEKAKLEFVSEDNSVAIVDETGKVTAQSSGETRIDVRSKKVSKTVDVFVNIIDVLKLDFPVAGLYDAMGPENSRFQFTVTAKNEKGENVDLSYINFSSSDPQVATINEKGEMTLLSDGKTTITAVMGKKRANLEVPVTILRPSAIKVDSARFSIGVGDTAYLPFVVISTQGTTLIDFPVKVEFEKEGIASADERGKVTGMAKGVTKVTITAGEATNTLTLTVK